MANILTVFVRSTLKDLSHYLLFFVQNLRFLFHSTLVFPECWRSEIEKKMPKSEEEAKQREERDVFAELINYSNNKKNVSFRIPWQADFEYSLIKWWK